MGQRNFRIFGTHQNTITSHSSSQHNNASFWKEMQGNGLFDVSWLVLEPTESAMAHDPNLNPLSKESKESMPAFILMLEIST
jgi:hypothetical protein